MDMAMMRMLYLIGVPGCGKSTLMARLVQGRRRRVYPKPFAYTQYEGGIVQLGRERAKFSGTDALSMSVQPVAIAMLETQEWPKVLGEGDRLANSGFFQAARDAGYELDIVLLECPPELAAARCVARGSNQDEKWLKGRYTRIQNLRPLATTTLDASLSTEQLAVQLSTHPIFTGD
jgi:dephospho-CoA kinase